MTKRLVNNDRNGVIKRGGFVIIRNMLFCIRTYIYYYILSFYDFYDIKKNIKKYIKNRYINRENGGCVSHLTGFQNLLLSINALHKCRLNLCNTFWQCSGGSCGRTASPKGSAHLFTVGVSLAPRRATFFIYTA
jgi:hypothetical protein